METKIEDFKLSDAMSWEETFLVTGKAAALPADTDPDDDFKREDALYVDAAHGHRRLCTHHRPVRLNWTDPYPHPLSQLRGGIGCGGGGRSAPEQA